MMLCVRARRSCFCFQRLTNQLGGILADWALVCPHFPPSVNVRACSFSLMHMAIRRSSLLRERSIGALGVVTPR